MTQPPLPSLPPTPSSSSRRLGRRSPGPWLQGKGVPRGHPSCAPCAPCLCSLKATILLLILQFSKVPGASHLTVTASVPHTSQKAGGILASLLSTARSPSLTLLQSGSEFRAPAHLVLVSASTALTTSMSMTGVVHNRLPFQGHVHLAKPMGTCMLP